MGVFDRERAILSIMNLAKETGSPIVLQTMETTDPYDSTRVKVKENWLKYNGEKGRWEEWGIACYDSSELGLGTCLCNSHDPYWSEEIPGEKVRERLRGLEDERLLRIGGELLLSKRLEAVSRSPSPFKTFLELWSESQG
jgi:hypothetical protein